MLFRVTRAILAVVGVVAEDTVYGGANTNQVVREAEELKIALVPHHQAKVLIDHANALVNVFNGGLKQRPVELQHLGGFIDNRNHIRYADTAPLKCRVDYNACR